MVAKKLAILFLVALIFGVFTSSQAAMSRAEKKYKLVILVCYQTKSLASVLREYVDLFVNREANEKLIKELDMAEKRSDEIWKSAMAKKDQVKTAGASFLEAEAKELKSISRDTSGWKGEMEKAMANENQQKDPVALGKIMEFYVYNFEVGRRQAIELLGFIDNPAHKEKVINMQIELEKCAPILKDFQKQAKEITMLGSVSKMSQAYGKLDRDMMPTVMVLSRASMMFSNLFFEEYDENDLKSVFEKTK